MAKRLTDYPMVWLALLALLALFAGRGLGLPLMGLRPLGWALAAAGLGLALWARQVMARAGATIDPTRPPTALVTHGPFRWSRNPIYLAAAILLAGLCLVTAGPIGLILVPVFILIINRRFIPQEEAWLRARDAAAFDAWAARTPRWL